MIIAEDNKIDSTSSSCSSFHFKYTFYHCVTVLYTVEFFLIFTTEVDTLNYQPSPKKKIGELMGFYFIFVMLHII